MPEQNPTEFYGAAKEGIHIAGYTLERAFSNIEWLLAVDSRWKLAGDGFAEVDDFIASLRLDKFKTLAEDRKRIVERVKKLQPKASNRAIGKMLGVDERTVRRDTAANAAPEPGKNESNQSRPAANAPPSGAEAAKLVKQQAERGQRHAVRRESAIARTQAVALDAKSLGKFSVILADPPWRYENPPMGATGRSIENHYPTMSLEEICDLSVEDIAHDTAVLFLWATAPKLAECMQVITSWGFVYRTNMVWVKDKIGMGYHARNKHEILLIAKRGELAPPLEENRPESVIAAPRAEHSEKPETFYDIIERMYPDLPRIELFARGRRESWASWGNDAAVAAQ